MSEGSVGNDGLVREVGHRRPDGVVEEDIHGKTFFHHSIDDESASTMWADTVFNGSDSYVGIVGKDNIFHWTTEVGTGHDELKDRFGDHSRSDPPHIKVTFYPRSDERPQQYFHVVSKYQGMQDTAISTVNYLKRSFGEKAKEAKVVFDYYKHDGTEDKYEGPLSKFQQV